MIIIPPLNALIFGLAIILISYMIYKIQGGIPIIIKDIKEKNYFDAIINMILVHMSSLYGYMGTMLVVVSIIYWEI